MTRRNYKSECTSLLAQFKSIPELHAENWEFSVYTYQGVDWISVVCIDFEKFGHYREYYACGSDMRRTWKELADYLRAFLLGFHNGMKSVSSSTVYVEIVSPRNSSGNAKRLYLSYVGGYRHTVSDVRPVSHIADTFHVSASEFREYARIAKVCKERK